MSTAASAAERANPGSLPQPLTNICIAFAVLGVVAFVGGVVTDPQTAWLAYHSNFIFFTMMACGGLMLSVIFTLVSASWPGPYRRFAESLGAFLPMVQHVLSPLPQDVSDHRDHGDEGIGNSRQGSRRSALMATLVSVFEMPSDVATLVRKLKARGFDDLTTYSPAPFQAIEEAEEPKPN